MSASQRAAGAEEIAGPRNRSAVGVLVLGMSRSGTSSVSRMFAAAGFHAGEESELMGASEFNPTGHWENLGVWELNEQVLTRLEGSWFDPPSTAAQSLAREWALPLIRAETDRILAQAAGRPIVIKDPRIGVMLPLWGEMLERLHPVLVVRDPIEVALSLHRRDRTPLPFGLAAWELHICSLLSHLQGRTVTIAPYARLLEERDLARVLVEATAAKLDPNLIRDVCPERAGEAFDSGLYRNRTDGIDPRSHLTGRQAQLWELLRELPAGDQTLDSPIELRAASDAALSAVRAETERIATVIERDRAMELTEARARERDQAIELSEARAHERDQAAHERDQASAALEQERGNSALLAAELDAERDHTAAALQAREQAEHWLAAVQGSASWRLTRPLRAAKRILRGGSQRR